MTIKVDRKGIIHYYAQCDNPNCSFDSCMFETVKDTGKTMFPEDVRRAVRRHVERTGHTVTIESGASTTYIKDE